MSDLEIAVAQVTQQLTAELTALESSLTEKKPDQSLLELTRIMDCALSELAATQCWGPANRIHSSRLWNAAQQWLARGQLQLHARTKPRGYAGDFELLEKIYRQTCGTDPLGGLFDRYFQNQAAPRAVRQRRTQLAARLAAAVRQRDQGAHVVSVGAGPAAEVLDACQTVPAERHQSLTITLLEMDPGALGFARQRIQPAFSGTLHTERTNLGRLATDRSWSNRTRQFDLVYCAGLLDYLDQEAAAAMLRLFNQWLAPGGEAVLFNFAVGNPTRSYMEWIGNWYLIYRDLAAMQAIVDRAAIQDAQLEVRSAADGLLIEVQLFKH